MPHYSDAPGHLDFLRYDVTNLAYYARHSGRAAVIGVGSGRDMLSAHLFGFRDITGVELNPIFIDLLTDPAKLRAYAGIADLPGVRFVVDDGRSWFARTQEKFDLIEMSMVDTWAATGAGAFSLSENGLYTVEGWKAFLSALTPNGLFTVSRWHSPRSTVELGRVVSLAVAALMELGVERPSDHIFVAGIGNLATAIVSRAPFARSDLQILQDAADKLRFTVLASPDRPATDPVILDMLTAQNLQDLNARAARHFLDVSPPTDARPFFFNQLRFTHPSDILFALREWREGKTLDSGSGWSGNLIAVGTLFLVILLSAMVVVYVVVLPTRSAVRQVDRQLALIGSGYFLLIGLGFMFAEIGLIQRISVFLGHPVYALSIGLFSIILSTGLGSLLSERLTPTRTGHFVFWLGLLAAYLLLLPLWLPDLLHSSLAAATLPWRALASVAVIFPAGLLMGFGFPTGMRLITRLDARLTPWLWGVNGASGVLAAGIEGFSSTQMTIAFSGGAMYSPTTSAALAENSGSSISHHDLRPSKSTRCSRSTRHTCCSCTSPSSAAIKPPERAKTGRWWAITRLPVRRFPNGRRRISTTADPANGVSIKVAICTEYLNLWNGPGCASDIPNHRTVDEFDCRLAKERRWSRGTFLKGCPTTRCIRPKLAWRLEIDTLLSIPDRLNSKCPTWL